MSRLFDPSVILCDHIRTLKLFGSGAWDRLALLVFFGLPLAAAALLTYLEFRLSDDIVGILITSMSIFAALLFNLLILVYDVIHKKSADEGAENAATRQEYLHQIFTNISFAVFASILVVILLLAYRIIDLEPAGLPGIVVAGVVYFCTTMFLLTLFMVLKRVHILLSTSFSLN